MKRYYVFAWNNLYPMPGWRDFLASFENLEEAKKVASETFDRYEQDYYSVGVHIVDIQKEEIIWKRESQR